jgi:hypothetical protein
MFGDEDLGTYDSPEDAFRQLITGRSFWPSIGQSPAECNLPKELADWNWVLA